LNIPSEAFFIFSFLILFVVKHEEDVIQKKKKWTQWLCDAWCITSIIGIWPRFIEPSLLSVTKLSLPIPQLPKDLNGLTLLQFSDLHWSSNFSKVFSKKLIKKINSLNPDFIFFTGDFLSRSIMENPEGLKEFLCSLKSKKGCFAVLGNHDYEKYVTISSKGDYDIESSSKSSDIIKGFKRLFSSVSLSKEITPAAKQVKLHDELARLLQNTPFKLLHNEVEKVSVNGSRINVLGLGEYMAGKADVESALKNYDVDYPGVVLVHNPDMIPHLDNLPGNLVLSGHTHGAQVNLPFLWKKLTCMENHHFKKGLKKQGTKWCYINKGIGSIMRFRWFAMPELTFITLRGVN
jgi:uncharacterized protein